MTAQHVLLSWTGTSLGAVFAKYVIARSDDGGTTYNIIAEVTTENVQSVEDHESRRGHTAHFRMRVQRTDGAVSAWTDVQQATLTSSSSAVFTSNEAPDEEVTYEVANVDLLGASLPEHRQVFDLHSRDMAVVLRGSENRGRRVEFDVYVARGDAVDDGFDEFDALLAISREFLSYKCVHLRNDRLFGDVNVTQIGYHPVTGAYRAHVEVVETTRTPSVFDAAA